MLARQNIWNGVLISSIEQYNINVPARSRVFSGTLHSLAYHPGYEASKIFFAKFTLSFFFFFRSVFDKSSSSSVNSFPSDELSAPSKVILPQDSYIENVVHIPPSKSGVMEVCLTLFEILFHENCLMSVCLTIFII